MYLTIERTCNDCGVCCEVPEIPELGKPMHELCKFCVARRCSIYSKRPEVCKEFICLWRRFPNILEFMRPKTSGIMLYVDQAQDCPAWIEVRVGLTKKGSQNWLREKYRREIVRFYKMALDCLGGHTPVLLRVYRPSGDVLFYDKALNQFVPWPIRQQP